MRLDKYLSGALGLSRSQVKEKLKKKQVTVGGKVVQDGSYTVSKDCDEIFFMGKAVVYEENRYFMFHKPAGCVTARKDKEHKTVFDYLEDLNTKDLFAVGRLDKDTEGLLLLTNDGAFDHALMSPKKHIEKTYYFEADGELDNEKTKRLTEGVMIAKDEPVTKPARLYDVCNRVCNEDYDNVCDVGYKDSCNKDETLHKVSGNLVITEGRFHQVKRMLRAVGCEITYLKRTAIGDVTLDETLTKGSYRALTKEEIERLMPEKRL